MAKTKNKTKTSKNKSKSKSTNTRKKQYLKLPNGFGSITKRTDKPRRKPFEVRKWFSDAQAQKVIGWFATYEEALAFLVEYNKDPSVYQADSITFEEAYALMAAERYPKIAAATANNYKAAYKQCTELYSMKIKDIKLVHLQRVIQTMYNGFGRQPYIPGQGRQFNTCERQAFHRGCKHGDVQHCERCC